MVVDGTVVHPAVSFDGVLQSRQCVFIRANGQRCKNRCMIGLPMCRPHLLQQYKILIQESTIQNAGVGLFAYDKTKGPNAVIFRPGQVIVPYASQHINQHTLDQRYGEYTAPYGIQISANHFEDGALQRGVGSLINQHPANRQPNCEFLVDTNPHHPGVVIKATKNIRNSRELFIDYGDDYRFNEPGAHYSTNNKKHTL